MPSIKSTVVSVLAHSGLVHACRPLTRHAGLIYMLHRFADPARGIRGYDPHVLRRLLAALRRMEVQLVSLETLFDSMSGDAPPLHHPVAFTIDDGYSDQATIAAPLFAEFDCPVTTFVTTGFLDGELWFWWDKIAFILQETSHSELQIEIDEGPPIRHDISTPGSRNVAMETLTARCKAVPTTVKLDAIERLATALEVHLPLKPPPHAEPMTWNQLRKCKALGMTFGPHTVTHPILARSDSNTAAHEIAGSWARLRAECPDPVPIFAYPNGQPEDFSEREFRILDDSGLRAAVTGSSGYATRESYRDPDGAFRVPRFPFPDSYPYLAQQVSGFERLKALLRGSR